MIRATAVACFFLIVSSGCATRGSVRQVAADVKAVRADLTLLRQIQATFAAQLAEIAGSVRTLRASIDGLQRALTTTADDVSRLSARVDATEAAVTQLRDSA